MALRQEEIRGLLQAALLTHEVEIDCDECLAEMPGLAEQVLAGQSAEGGPPLVSEHLALCSYCHEEYAALLRALRDGGEAS